MGIDYIQDIEVGLELSYHFCGTAGRASTTAFPAGPVSILISRVLGLGST